MSNLILPGDFEFEATLARIPPNWKEIAAKSGDNYAFVAEPGTGLLRCVDGFNFREYLLGGEYDERLNELGYESDYEFYKELEGVPADQICIDF